MHDSRPLAAILDDAWSMLARGVDDPLDDLHWPVLASVGRRGDAAFADARTVVLRACSPGTRSVSVHSDAHAGKIAQLRAHPAAALVAFHRPTRIQLRLHGVVALHTDDAAASAAWQALPDHSRALYAGPHRFCLIRIAIHQLDWLRIDGSRQHRAAFDLTGDPAPHGRWIDP
jgi:hypothetical protein